MIGGSDTKREEIGNKEEKKIRMKEERQGERKREKREKEREEWGSKRN